MIKTLHFVFSIVTLMGLYGCATHAHRKMVGQVRQHTTSAEYDKALLLVDKSPLAKDKKEELLYLMEKGLLHHYMNDLVVSTQILDAAKAKIQELYTTRISGKLTSAISNDTQDFFYGEKYEASMVHFYLALNHFLQSQQSTDNTIKREFLLKARAEILAWDSFLNSIRDERLGQAVFKDDLLAKIFGAIVHEAQGDSNDNQTALLLYRESLNLLFKNYNVYASFNQRFDSFRNDFAKLPSMTKEEVMQNYVTSTPLQNELKEFLTFKILSLTKKLRPDEYAQWQSDLAPSTQVLSMLEQKGQPVVFILQDGLISMKEAKKFSFPFEIASNMMGFASGTLGVAVATGIEFELPNMTLVPQMEVGKLQAMDINGQVVAVAPLPVTTPLSDVAEQAIGEHATSVRVKTGTRVAGKHIAAIAAAFATYQAMKSQGQEAFASLGATISYAAAASAIASSEQADTRFWSILPASIRIGQIIVPEGTFRFQAIFEQPGVANSARIVNLGDKHIKKSSAAEVYQARIHGNEVKAQAVRSIASKPEGVPIVIDKK